MSSNVLTSPFLRTSRDFPEDPQALRMELNKAYIDIANAVNQRTVSIFPTARSITTGDSYFLSGNRKQQSLRQVYQFTSTGNIPHGINFASVSEVLPKCYGSFTDGTNWYGAIFGSSVAIAGQVSFYLTSANIVVLAGAGAPGIVSGVIVVEWLSNS